MPLTIPVQDAIDLTTNWRTYFENLDPMNNNYIRAFEISKAMVTALAAMEDADAYRVYLGSDSSTNIDAEHLQLLFVGIDTDGNDITQNEEDESLVFDFTKPCPNSCDLDSPLFDPVS